MELRYKSVVAQREKGHGKGARHHRIEVAPGCGVAVVGRDRLVYHPLAQVLWEPLPTQYAYVFFRVISMPNTELELNPEIKTHMLSQLTEPTMCPLLSIENRNISKRA